ncbi:hypothetical protein MTR67_049892 [Solanum verrucosum]|uniref:Uncharacterized protein n=1 Tax=Solanum verrucosum TaxID=315347 RepID=A0AAF0ZXU7_SOLVR|nr:hypothetical protein MTR67_049892 [Solanum verrucosum]
MTEMNNCYGVDVPSCRFVQYLAVRPYPRFASHYHPHGPSYYDRERLQIYISDAGVISTTYVLYCIALAQG